MDTYVINLDRSFDRWQAFEAVNGRGLPHVFRMAAIDGRVVSRPGLVASGVVAADLRNFSDGAVGAALSHATLWDVAAERNCALTICEDDAVFHREFLARAEALVAGLGADWDIVLWGWNFDSILTFELVAGNTPCLMTFDQAALREGIAAFQVADIAPRLHRLYHAFGLLAYSVSPEGARRLKQFCLPLRNMEVSVSGLGRVLPNHGLDIMLNALYGNIRAAVSFPPLVVTAHDRRLATV